MKAYEQIGRKLQKAREEMGLSQEELARRLGYTQPSLSNYELGKRRLYLADLEKICIILQKPIAYFLEDQELNNEQEASIADMMKEQYLREILLDARELDPAQRKSVLDFIQWQKSLPKGGTS